MVDGGRGGGCSAATGVLVGGCALRGGVFELPGAKALVELQAGVVVALVEVFEDAGEDLGFSCNRVSRDISGSGIAG